MDECSICLEDLIKITKNNRVDLYIPSAYLMKYQVNPIIDLLAEITKKFDVIPFEDDITSELDYENMEGSFNIFGLCERYVNSMSTLDPDIKLRLMDKINSVYQTTIKDEK